MLRPRLLPLAAARTPRARVIAVCCAFAAGATPSAHAQPAAQHAPASPAEPAPHPPASATQPAPLAQPSSPPAPAAAPAPSAPEDLAQARRQYEFGPEVCPFCAITPEAPAGRTGLHWHEHWKPVSTPEYIATPLLAATALTLELFVEPAIGPSWDSPILFDSAVRDALRIDSASGRETAKNVSDVLSLVSIAHPLIDNFFVTWYLRRAPRVAWQMFVINAQAYSLTLALNTITKRLSSRARPWVEGCAENEPELCGSGESYRAFYSGHAAVTATGAGLICAHHTQLSLYQNDLLDAGACVIAVLGTAVTGAMRVASDNHWASDVVVGHLAGYVSGYLLPTLLYYREFRLTPEPAPEDTGPTFAVFPVPVFDGESLQLGLSGIF